MNTKRLLPVLHCEDDIEHILRNVRIVFEAGADGIFLISHNYPKNTLIYQYNLVRKFYPNKWIGINFLDLMNDNSNEILEDAIKACKGIDAIWIDRNVSSKIKLVSEIEIFGGVAFKYINPNATELEMKNEVEVSIRNGVTSITTSGSKTGSPPELKKIKTIRKFAGEDIRIAIASGINADNISTLKSVADDFLVATSITEKQLGYDEFIPEKIEALLKKIHS